MKSFLKTLLAAFTGTFAALLICTFIFFGLIVSLASLGGEGETSVIPSSAILKIDLSQPLQDRESMDNISVLTFNPAELLSSQSGTNLYNAVKAVEAAANDPAIKFIYINATGPAMSVTALEELREALLHAKDAGKGIIAYARSMSQGGYYVASVADKIYVNKASTPNFVGLSANILFFKDILEKLGINVQLIRHGKFKAAGEQFTKNGMTAENREQNEVMLHSIWESWTDDICKSREISAEKFNALVENLSLGDAESLVENNLVDEAVTESELTDILCTLFSVEKEKELQFVPLAKYAKAKVTPNVRAKDKVAIVYASGEIMMAGSMASAKELNSEIKKVSEDSSVKAVVLRVNSPGGDAHAAELIREQLQRLRANKPLIVSFGEYAASGGYWISAQSDKIFTDRTTITGSIGVFSMAFSIGDAMKKQLHVNSESVGTHSHSDMVQGFRKLNNAEVEYMQGMVEKIYTQFTGIVASGRGMNEAYVDSIGQGRVWTGAMAKEIRLADHIGGIADAVEFAAGAAGLADYRVVEYPKAQSPIDMIMKSFGESAASAALLADPFALVEKYYKDAINQKSTTVYARIPYMYEISLR